MEGVTVESVKRNRDSISLDFDDGSVVTAGLAYLPPEYADLCPGAVLGEEAAAILRHGENCLAAERAALRLITRAEQCALGLTRKLEQRKHGPAAVKAVLDRLLGLGLVDDRRYAELWLKFPVSRGSRGPRILRAALRAKGIDRETAEAALEAALAGEAELKLLGRCLKKAPRGKQPEQSGSEIRYFLKTEGFSTAAIEGYFDGTN
ncbi:MAG: recombination regulator RecX [Spirochaetaceae bacterium]|jgi:SOS response regulatory protein OraA/RecX|nr:recombination regulator RecX [Spirochaetaceae bacterium]